MTDASIDAGFSGGIVGDLDAVDDVRADRDRDIILTDTYLDLEVRDPVVVSARGSALLNRLGF